VFDVEQVGTTLTIRRSISDVIFSATKDTAHNQLHTRELNLWAPPFHMLATSRSLFLGQYSSDLRFGIYFHLDGWRVQGGTQAVLLDSSREPDPRSAHQVSIMLPEGATIHGTGVTVGVNASSAHHQPLPEPRRRTGGGCSSDPTRHGMGVRDCSANGAPATGRACLVVFGEVADALHHQVAVRTA
jgi:hypothetical protein